MRRELIEPVKAFGLSAKEWDILTLLKTGRSFKVATMSQNIMLPRTTVHFLLKKMRARKLVKAIKVVNHYEWVLEQPEIITKKIDALRHFFYPIEKEKIETVNLKIFLSKGLPAIKSAYDKILTLSKTERVYFIQGLKSAESALKKIDGGYFFDFHKKLKERKIILEGISGEGLLKLFRGLSRQELKSHAGRLLVCRLIPDEYVNFEADILIIRETMYIINTQTEEVIAIRNKTISDAFKNLFNFFEDRAEKIDLNEYIVRLLK